MTKNRKGERPPLVNCSPDDVWRLVKKLGGFIEKPGTKHGKIEHTVTKHCGEIPRHNPVNRYIMRDFVEDYLVKKCGFTLDQVYTYLWC